MTAANCCGEPLDDCCHTPGGRGIGESDMVYRIPVQVFEYNGQRVAQKIWIARYKALNCYSIPTQSHPIPNHLGTNEVRGIPLQECCPAGDVACNQPVQEHLTTLRGDKEKARTSAH